jgi:hypothetical protein
MRRAGLIWALAASFAVLVGCSSSSSNNDSGNTGDSGNNGDAGSVGGTITTASSGNKIPTAWPSSAIADFAWDNTGNANKYVSQVVQFNGNLTVALGGSGQCNGTGTPSCTTCPSHFVSTSHTTGKSYCDGVQAVPVGVDAGNPDAGFTVFLYGDDFSYLASSSACTSSLQAGGNLTSIRGVWADHYDSASHTDNWSIALTNCSDVGIGTAYSGTGTPRAGTVGALLANPPSTADGGTPTVTVTGVVTAAWSAGGGASFGAVVQDYAGGVNTGIAIGKSSSSASTAAPPAIGDDVTVTGAFSNDFGTMKISL